MLYYMAQETRNEPTYQALSNKQDPVFGKINHSRSNIASYLLVRQKQPLNKLSV